MKPYAAVVSRSAVRSFIESSWCRGFLKSVSEDACDLSGVIRPQGMQMPVEMELKVKVVSHETTRQRLRIVGAAEVGLHLEVNSFFDNEDRSLLASDKGLRIRVAHDVTSGKHQAILTYKGPRQPGAFKSREECETDIDNAENLATILKALGYIQVLSFEKKRESWTLDDCKVELDEVPYLGCYVEVEGPTEQSIKTVQQKLGLETTPTVRESYAGMLTTWLQERGSREKIVIFPKT